MIHLRGNLVPSAVPRQRRCLISDVIPESTVLEWGIKLFTLMSLSWSYVDTIIDLCIAARRDGTKELSRRVRNIKRRYDKMRYNHIDSKFEKQESARSERFEEFFGEDFDRLFNAVDFEVSKLGLKGDDKTFITAVYQALAVMEAVKLYARDCDAEMHRTGIAAHDLCMVQDEFLELYSVVPKFLGKLHIADRSAVTLSAGIIKNRIQWIKVTANKDEAAM